MSVIKNCKCLAYRAVIILCLALLAACSSDAPEGPLPALLEADPELSIFVAALTRSDLLSALENRGPYTVFAPNDEAFSNLFADRGVSDLAGLTEALGDETVLQLLLYHLVKEVISPSDIEKRGYGTLASAREDAAQLALGFEANEAADQITVNAGTQVLAARAATNGYIYKITDVLPVPDAVLEAGLKPRREGGPEGTAVALLTGDRLYLAGAAAPVDGDLLDAQPAILQRSDGTFLLELSASLNENSARITADTSVDAATRDALRSNNAVIVLRTKDVPGGVTSGRLRVQE